MKVALVVHCFFPDHFYGTETYTLELANNLIALGHEPVVVSAVFQGEAKRRSAITSYEYMNIPVYCLDKNYYPHRTIRETYYQPDLLELHKQLLSEIAPDILHVTHLINHTASLLDAAKELGIPALATLTDFFGFCFNNRLEAADGSLCNGPSSDRINCLTCYFKARICQPSTGTAVKLISRFSHLLPVVAQVSTMLAQIPGVRHSSMARLVADIVERPVVLLNRYAEYQAVIAPTLFLSRTYSANGLSAPLHLMPFGVDIDRVSKKKASSGAPVRFGYIGQIAAHKGVDILVSAFSRLAYGCAELHIYGSEEQAPLYVAALRDTPAENPILFQGTFPKKLLADVLSEIDFLVIPSRWYENSPLVLLNALATHTPVIVSNVEGMTEFVKDGQNGFIFDRANIDDLEKVLQKVVQEPELSYRMSKNTKYDRTTREMTEDVVRLYESIVKIDGKLN